MLNCDWKMWTTQISCKAEENLCLSLREATIELDWIRSTSTAARPWRGPLSTSPSVSSPGSPCSRSPPCRGTGQGNACVHVDSLACAEIGIWWFVVQQSRYKNKPFLGMAYILTDLFCKFLVRISILVSNFSTSFHFDHSQGFFLYKRGRKCGQPRSKNNLPQSIRLWETCKH